MLILVKHLLAAASVASVFPFKEKKPHFTVVTLESFHNLLGRKNATTDVHEQLVWMMSTIFLSLTLSESVTKPAAVSAHQTQRVVSSFSRAHDDVLVHEVEDVEDTLEQPLDVQTRFRSHIQSSIRIVGSRF